jgi:hypothetical protein
MEIGIRCGTKANCPRIPSGGESGQGHLDDLVLGTALTQGSAQGLDGLHGQPAILGEEHRAGALEPFSDVGYSLDLFWSWHLCVSLDINQAPRQKTRGFEKRTCAGGHLSFESWDTGGLGPRYWSCVSNCIRNR